jgi:hypothetical protein
MNESKKRFADQLLSADPPSPGVRDRYEKEIRAMLEKTLTPRQRGVYLLAAFLLVLLAGFFGVAASAPDRKPDFLMYVVAYLAASALVLLIVAGLLFRAFWKGVVDRRASRRWAAGVGVVYVGLMGWLLMLMSRYIPELLRDDTRILGLVMVLYAAVAWVRHRLAASELRTAESLLEIELRLAEISEALAGRSQPTPPA